MTTHLRSRRIESGSDGAGMERRESADPTDESSRGESSFPDDPREQRRVRNRLIVLALAVAIPQLLWFLFH